ncbi:MAG TPA: NAD(P)H-quinone oxidoreductase [Gemmatimonadaceae bacterium]|nr:NAD(P)H-quinone oxidoreductase [Gemmatimonadaceae bacterium]
MRAAVITQPGGPEVLAVRDVPRPEPGPHEVAVRVRASALNRADLLQRQGRYPAPNDSPRDIPGLEFAGEVATTGPAVTRWRRGDRVCGIIGGGAQAEFLVAHEGALARVPERLGWPEAAAIPEAFITAYDAMITQAALTTGESVLIHAVGSGVGLAAVQVARAWGATPYGTSRTADKLERARAFGLADGCVVGTGLDGLTAFVGGVTGGRGVDVILDLVGGTYVSVGIECLALKGRLMIVGTMAGTQATIDVRRVLGRRLTLRGTVLRARPLAEKIAVTEAFARDVLPLFDAGRLAPVIDRVFPLESIGEAHRHLESNETFGKVVIEIG